jgi:hypothetical protein
VRYKELLLDLRELLPADEPKTLPSTWGR